MSDFTEALDEETVPFIERQKLFFVATAPRRGRINLSPKGMGTLRVLDRRTVAYLDLTGSGNESATHIADDGRMTMMFCSFAASQTSCGSTDKAWPVPPGRALRRARRLLRGRRGPPPDHRVDDQLRSVVLWLRGPLLTYEGERPTLTKWATSKGEEGLAASRKRHNERSIDGLAVELPRRSDE